MEKQTHDPRIWRQGWFIALPINYKLLFIFAWDNANQAGIWRTDKLYFEELNKDIKKIDFDKFLNAVNKHQIQISVLPDNTWFFNYYITSTLGNIYKSRYDKMIKALKIAFLSGVPLEWIKGFANPEKIDKEAVENSYIQKAIKYVSGLPKDNVLAQKSNTNTEIKPFTVVKHLKGTAPNFILPEISYTSYGGEKYEEIERWFDEYDFSPLIEIKNINSAIPLKKQVQDFLEKLQLRTHMSFDEITKYFANFIRGMPVGQPLYLHNGTDPPNNKSSNNKFSSIKKYQDLKNARKNNDETKDNNDKKT